MAPPGDGPGGATVVLYYSPEGRDHLEALLRRNGIEVYPVAGRAPHALEEIQRHPSAVVVIDGSANDISIGQTVRKLGRTLPDSLIVTACACRPTVQGYRRGLPLGVFESLEAAVRRHSDVLDANRMAGFQPDGGAMD